MTAPANTAATKLAAVLRDTLTALGGIDLDAPLGEAQATIDITAGNISEALAQYDMEVEAASFIATGDMP